MRTFTRIWLAISLLSIAFGTGIVIVLAASGGGFKGWSKVATTSFNETYDNVTKIDFDIDFGRVYIKEGETFSIIAENIVENTFESYVSNGTWFIKEDYDKEIKIFGKNVTTRHIFNWNDDYEKIITITLPKDFIADEYNLSIGAGEVEVQTLYAKEGYLNVGAGVLNIDKLTISGTSRYEVGAGSMKIKDLSAQDTRMECGIGSIIIEGTLTGKNVIDCGIGRIKLDLRGVGTDYSYELDAGLGNVVIDGQSYHSINKRINNSYTDNKLVLECGIGSIVVDFHW